MIWGNLRRTLHTREATPPLHPMPSTRSVVAVPVLVPGAPLSIVASSVSLIPPPSRWYVRVNESITPLELSTNSYRMIVGETWNQPKPLAGGVTRHAATQALVRHVPVPDAPPVPTIR